MKFRFLTVFVVCGALASCATLPAPPSEQGVRVDMLVDAIQCELKNANTKLSNGRKKPRLDGMAVGFDLELKVVDENNGSLGGSLIIPVAGGTLTPSLQFGATGSATRTAKLFMAVAFEDLSKAKLKNCNPSPGTGFKGAPLKLGLEEWIVQSYDAFDDYDVSKAKKLTYDLEFVVVHTANGGIALAVAKGSADLKAGLSHKDSQVLTVAMTQIPPPAGPLQVSIVGPVTIRGVSLPSISTAQPQVGRRSVRTFVPTSRSQRGRGVPESTVQELQQMIEAVRPQRIRVTQ